MGGMFATGLLARLWWEADVDTMVLLAAYVILQAKECVPYCGKWSQIVRISEGKVRFLPFGYVNELDVVFQRYMAIERVVFRYLAAPGPGSEWKDVARLIREIRRDIEKLADKLARQLPADT